MKNFFSDLHKSIFDPDFHAGAVKRTRRSIFLFLLTLLVVTSLVSGMAKAYYITHPKRGIAPAVYALFGDLEISGGRLIAKKEVPYEAPRELVSEVMNRLAGQPGFFGGAPDNFLVVDTRDEAGENTEKAKGAAGRPKILMGETAVRFADMGIAIPYETLVGKEFRITEQSVRKFLTGIIIHLSFHFITMSFFFGAITAILSVFFLSAAAYLFSVDRSGGFRHFIRLACFSITPVMLGSALVALSGVNAGWTWHVFIVMSTVIMYRAASKPAAGKPAGEAF